MLICLLLPGIGRILPINCFLFAAIFNISYFICLLRNYDKTEDEIKLTNSNDNDITDELIDMDDVRNTHIETGEVRGM